MTFRSRCAAPSRVRVAFAEEPFNVESLLPRARRSHGDAPGDSIRWSTDHAAAAVTREDEMSPIRVQSATTGPICTFAVGQSQLGIFVDRAAAKPADATQRPLATFEHAGVHFVVRELGRSPGDALGELLTLREREIARLVAAGLRNKQIAFELRLSEYTVAAYIKHICYKLQVRNRTAMVTRCNELRGASLSDVAAGARRSADDARAHALAARDPA